MPIGPATYGNGLTKISVIVKPEWTTSFELEILKTGGNQPAALRRNARKELLVSILGG
jgi:hypothetical protein